MYYWRQAKPAKLLNIISILEFPDCVSYSTIKEAICFFKSVHQESLYRVLLHFLCYASHCVPVTVRKITISVINLTFNVKFIKFIFSLT